MGEAVVVLAQALAGLCVWVDELEVVLGQDAGDELGLESVPLVDVFEEVHEEPRVGVGKWVGEL